MNRLILAGLTIALILGGIIIWPKIAYRFEPDPSSLPKKFRTETQSFAALALKEQFVPEELLFTLQEKQPNQLGDVHIANWNRDGQYFSYLVGLTSNNSAINYRRIWIAPEVEPIDETISNTKLSEIFSDSFLNQTGKAVCKKGTPTECGAMKSTANGDLLGVTVRSPIALPSPPGIPPMDVTIISACFVPKNGTSAYNSSLCI